MNGPASVVTFALVRRFVEDAEAANMFTESMTFEAKERRNGNNIAEAVGALSNTDGGVVLVGVKDQGAVGEARIVGVPKAEHDNIVSNLRNLIPTAMPEVIAVRIPKTDKLVIVLRVDADAVAHPVLVSGKVLYRVSGQSVSADRQRVLDLVARDAPPTGPQPYTAGRMAVPIYPWQPTQIELLPPITDSAEGPPRRAGELRVVGGLTLPGRIADRPWIDSRARQAAEDVLNNSPLRFTPAWSIRVFDIVEARATTLRLYAAPVEDSAVNLEAAAYLNLAGRTLSTLITLRWSRSGSLLEPLALQWVYVALLGALVTVTATYRQVAAALDAAEPSDIKPFQAWLTSSSRQAFDVIDMPFRRDNRDKPQAADFPTARPLTTGLADLDQLVRDWLTYWLLEIGARDFENWLVDLDVPLWLKFPTLPLPRTRRGRR
jgi:hypothetical protein